LTLYLAASPVAFKRDLTGLVSLPLGGEKLGSSANTPMGVAKNENIKIIITEKMVL